MERSRQCLASEPTRSHSWLSALPADPDRHRRRAQL